MSLYPSLEDMKVDQMVKAQSSAIQQAVASPQVQGSLPYPVNPSAPGFSSVYPELSTFMGMEFNEEVIRQNMPEYLELVKPSTTVAVAPNTQVQPVASGVVAPISGDNPLFQKSQVNHAIRQVVLCKDGNGKVGLRVKSIDKGVFVALVTKGCPAAMGGLRFGDQILQINGENMAGYTEAQVHKIFKKAGVNNICLAIRDRPFERTLTLHKDSTGHIGFQYKEGLIKAIVVGSSAARNGLLTSHNLVEVNGQNVVGVSDKEIGDIIDSSGNVITITVLPSFVFKHMVKNMSQSMMKKMMDHSVPEL